MPPWNLPAPLTRDPTDNNFAVFLSTCSGSEVVKLVQDMVEPVDQLTMTMQLMNTPATLSGPQAVQDKQKKAMNAFVGFRCYYVGVPDFKHFPMKKLSGLLGTMWEVDPNKSLWTLMGRAYSVMRDEIGKANAPLHEFLSIICPRLNIPSPDTYLQLLGWQFSRNEEGNPVLERVNTPPPNGGVSTAAPSIEDIIGYCQFVGYAQGHIFNVDLTSSAFLGHSTGTSSNAELDAWNRRRARLQTARETGFAQAFQERYVQAAEADGFKMPEDPSEVWQFGSDPGPFRAGAHPDATLPPYSGN